MKVLVRFLVSTFESFLGFRTFFPCLSPIFLRGQGEPEVKLRHVVYEVWLVSHLFFSFQIMVLLKMNNHEHRAKQTYESYTFQPLMSFWRKLIQCRGRIANFFFTPPPKDPQTTSRKFHLNRNKLGIYQCYFFQISVLFLKQWHALW